MSGTGSWQNLLPDEQARNLYAELYSKGLPSTRANDKLLFYLDRWKRGRIIKMEGEQITPIGPIMTDSDLEILQEWFEDIVGVMVKAVLEKIDEYRRTALDLAGKRSSDRTYVDNIATILICALTLDSQVFSILRKVLMGTYPARDFAGRFFFWGYGFSKGPSRIFGFTTYGWRQGPRLHVLRSHGLDREKIKALFRRADTFECIQHLALEKKISNHPLLDENYYPSVTPRIINELKQSGIVGKNNPPRLSIPVFSDQAMAATGSLFREVAEKIKNPFLSRLKDLDELIEGCSFRYCTNPDIYCMIFHLAYSFGADKLLENSIIPDFPRSAGGEWGVWIN